MTGGCLILPKLDGSYFPKRLFLGKVNQHCVALTFVFHHATTFLKNYQITDHENKVA